MPYSCGHTQAKEPRNPEMLIPRKLIPGILTGFTVLANSAAQDKFFPPSSYYAPAGGLSGDALRAALHDIIDDHHEVSYSWPPFLDIDESTTDHSHIELIYSDATRPKDSNGGAAGNWNREHLWPRNFGIGNNGPDNADLFNLRPSDVQVNSERGSLVFADTNPLHSLPLQFSAPGCSRDNNSWEPRNDEKGDIARSCFYMATRYDGSDPATADLRLADIPDASAARFGRLLTLIRWHHLDPVDQAERKRNHAICTRWQGNRNPFIDHPEFVGLIFLANYPALDQDGDQISDWWEYRQFGNLSISGNDDPDHDSANTLLEFAVASDPGDPGQRPEIRFSTGDRAIHVSYNWNQLAKGNGITATIQSSTSLSAGSWRDVAPINTSSIPIDTESEQITLTLAGEQTRLRVFYRLRIISSAQEDSQP